jgi:branched-chain amino acid transport system permease protein
VTGIAVTGTGTGPHGRMRRWSRLSGASTGAAVAIGALLVLAPEFAGSNSILRLTNLLILVLLAVMWNTLAGFGGMVSIGQQAFVGLGAYATVYLVHHGQHPYIAMAEATLVCGLLALPLSVFMLRLRPAQFAIAMWVVAEVLAILVTLDSSLGAGTGTSLIEFNYYEPTQRQNYTYWWTLAAALIALVVVFLLLRSPLGASLQAIRDDEEAAASLGVRVTEGKTVLFVLAAVGCGAAGAATLANTLFIEPTSIFSVSYTAYMIFMVLVGGLGTYEGPILGAVVLWVIQTEFISNGTVYLAGIGVTAIVFAIFVPRGVWGLVTDRFGIQLLPVGRELVVEEAAAEEGRPG